MINIKGTSQQIIQWLFNQDKEKIFEIREFKEKRTLTQNAYYWQLVTKLADALRTSKEELHAEMLRRYAPRDFVSLLADVDPKDYFDYYEYQGTFKSNNNTFKSYLLFRNSKRMNKAEFGILLDGLISDCKECGIETLTPEQLANLKFIEER